MCIRDRVQPEWYQVCAQLRQGNEDVAYYMGNDYKPVPPTVLKICLLYTSGWYAP